MRTVHVKLLPKDEDGIRKVRIHFFVRDENGPAKNPDGTLGKRMRGMGAKGFIACQPTLSKVTPQVAADGIHPMPHSDDVRAVTCDLCLATEQAKEMLAVYADTLNVK